MSHVEIYSKDLQVDSMYFQRDFYIVERLTGEIVWHTGKQEEYSKGGEIKVWIQKADTDPRISYILPDWRLFIDGIMQDSKFYDGIENIGNRVIELQHREYRFVFCFSGVEHF